MSSVHKQTQHDVSDSLLGKHRVMINGAPGDRISHVRGSWQGDPLSPMLFMLIMEVLNIIIKKADPWVS
jgi:hypothetical protein